MSDRVTNAEVEDVLSSIRRLVSDEHRPGRAKKSSPTPSAQETDRLVLTPALRVADGTSSERKKPAPTIESLVTDDVPLNVYDDELDPDALGPEEQELIAAAEEDEFAVETGEFGSEVTSSRLAGLTDADTDPIEWAERGTDEADDIENLAQEEELTEDLSVSTAPAPEACIDEPVTSQTDEAPMLSSSADVKAAALSAKIAALETAIGKISDRWEPDDVGESDYAGTKAQVMAWDDDGVDEKTPQKPLLAPVARKKVEETPVDSPLENTESDAEPATAEPPMKGFTSQRRVSQRLVFEDSPAEEDPDAASPVVEEKLEAFVPAAVVEEEAPNLGQAEDEDVSEEDKGVLSTEDALLDEEALRELISEIVRAELQGALGERITRNVRRLVRREINRALTVQDLE